MGAHVMARQRGEYMGRWHWLAWAQASAEAGVAAGACACNSGGGDGGRRVRRYSGGGVGAGVSPGERRAPTTIIGLLDTNEEDQGRSSII